MIDAHVHLWQIGRHGCRWPGPDLLPLYRDFTLTDLDATIGGLPIERVILVQTQEDEVDTEWLLSLAHDDRRVGGVVGWIDLRADDARERLIGLMKAGPLVGVRPMVQDQEDDWYDDPARDAGFAALAELGLVLDALVRPRHLASLARLAERHPTLAIVINHAAKPAGGIVSTGWLEAMRPLAALPQVACKVSGLLTEIADDQPVTIARSCMDALHLAFGGDRLIWGSDWPVLLLRESYGEWYALARATIPVADHAAVFGDNARRIYRLTGGAEDAA